MSRPDLLRLELLHTPVPDKIAEAPMSWLLIDATP